MRFRIVEIKRKYQRPFFKPQYKTFLFWYNIADSEWVDTFSCNYTFSEWCNASLLSKNEAKKCIEDYKKWLNSCVESDTIHNYS